MKRRLRTALVAVAAVGALGACGGNPSAKAVALDYVDGLGLTPEQRTCMRGQIEPMSEDQIKAIGVGNEALAFGSSFDEATATPEWRAFVEQLRAACFGG